MENQKKIDFEDFKLENIIDPNYKPAGSPADVDINEDSDTDDDTDGSSEVVLGDTNKNKNLEQKPAKAPKTPKEPKGTPIPKVVPDTETDEDEVEPDGAVVENPDESPEIDFKPFYQLFHEKLGWEVPEEDMPENSMDGFINYINSLAEEASKPRYANELSEQFDRYLANNGDPKKFMETMFGSKDYSKVSLKTDEDKKAVLHDYLSKTNPDRDESWRERKIQRYEDSGVLDDEAADALEQLTEYDQRSKKEIAAQQEAEERERQETVKRQLDELRQTIAAKTDIAGIPVNQKEMRDFYSFLTQPDKDGYTPYQKVLAQDKEAVIKMAYIAFKKFDVNNLKSNVRSDVVKDVKKALSRFSATNSGLQSRTGLPAKSNKIDYKDFDLGL